MYSFIFVTDALFATVAAHPNVLDAGCHSSVIQMYKEKLLDLCSKSYKVLAIGRTGLDFSVNELKYVPKKTQIALVCLLFYSVSQLRPTFYKDIL